MAAMRSGGNRLMRTLLSDSKNMLSKRTIVNQTGPPTSSLSVGTRQAMCWASGFIAAFAQYLIFPLFKYDCDYKERYGELMETIKERKEIREEGRKNGEAFVLGKFYKENY